MYENTLRNSPQLTIEFSAQTAKVAQKSGYKLTSFATTHSLEFAEPPRRRMDSTIQTPIVQPNPSNLRNNTVSSMEAYTRAMEEADSFLNVNNLQESLTTSSQPPPPNTDSQPINLSSQTTSTQTTSKSPQPRLHFNPHSPSTSEIGLAPLQQPPDELKVEREGLVHKIKTEKEEPTHYFELLYQPNEKQRKSYKNENRYILPNPLTIVLNKHMKEKKVKIDKGTVTVGLLYDTGEELEENREHILDGVKTRTLDKEKKAQFHLKVVETSDRNRFRLQFIVRFFMNKVEHVEKIVSHCFRVTSNKKSASIEKPRPFAIKPSYGPTSCETEVWIRGKLFTDRANTSVTFGGKPARVIETEDNILVCYAPAREDLVEDCTVEVKVTNHKGDQTESLDASKILEFTYLSERKRKRIKKETNEMNEIPKENENPILKETSTESSVLYCPPSPSAYPQLDDIVKNEAELIDRLGYFFPSYFPMEAI